MTFFNAHFDCPYFLRLFSPGLLDGKPGWIGLYDTGMDNWEWTDGSSSTLRNWQLGQPNDSDHRCVIVSNFI